MPKSSTPTNRSDHVRTALAEHILDHGKLAIVKAPPGSGKTWQLLHAAQFAFAQRSRVAIATQTNSQADDICRRIASEHPRVRAIRFAAQGHAEEDFGPNVTWATAVDELPTDPCVVVGTSAKWGLVTLLAPFDLLFVEEAWQLAWADFMLLGRVSGRFVLIGDPGQIAPVVTVDVARWETSPRPPHRAAPEVILSDPKLRKQCAVFELQQTRRLPLDTLPLVQPFYDFGFSAFAKHGDRVLSTKAGGRRAVDRVVEILRGSSVAALTIPTLEAGPPMDVDTELAKVAAGFVQRLLSSEAMLTIDRKKYPLSSEHIGLVATHRVMNAELEKALPARARHIMVDTPERWQGLQRPVMVIVHPLSGTLRPSAFDLATGRLCVMASRHQVSVVVVTRDHVGDTLRQHIPAADQPIGRDDVTGRGHWSNLAFWDFLEANGRIVPA